MFQTRKGYSSPELDLQVFSTPDVITASDGFGEENIKGLPSTWFGGNKGGFSNE